MELQQQMMDHKEVMNPAELSIKPASVNLLRSLWRDLPVLPTEESSGAHLQCLCHV